ncbi:MAG: DUF4178 domain-containing protein [Desulfobulbaceae bacterium]|nr:DUF4178 domain-containing protein [Desulfobulbaceae bacterium]
MKKANCPSCGALVVFRSTASIMAVCEYCRSTLVRRDADVENIGKMAELLEDASLIQVGTEGRYRKIHFMVVGRIQLQYPQGLWNEWYLQFDNQQNGWLGETNGDYVISFLSKIPETPPGFADISAGMTVTLDGKPYTVTDVENVRCIAGEGELPFRVEAGFAASSVDLRSGKSFASIDYSEETPLLYLGEAVDAAGLHLSNLRDPAAAGAAKTRLTALQCPACAASIELHAQGILRVTCPSCHTLLDAETDTLKLLKKFADKKRIAPFIPLGSEGKFDGVLYRVIGFLQRQGKCDGEQYSWDEYLLYNPTQGFRWLTEYAGHWNLCRSCNSAPTRDITSEKMVLDGRIYTHSERTLAKVSYVEGEFYWRVSDEERTTVDDFVAPPDILSQEKYQNEITWTHGRYIEPELVQQAFAIAKPMPTRSGVSPNQPWPHEESYRAVWRSFWIASLVLLLIQVVSVLRSENNTVYKNNFDLPAGNTWGGATAEYEITGHTGNIHLINQTNLDNDWLYLGMELVSRETGQVYTVHRDISYYHGYDDGEWTEGSTRDDATIANVPPGHYLMTLDAETDLARKSPVLTALEVQRNVSNWHNYFIIECLLLLFPALYLWRRSTFAAER